MWQGGVQWIQVWSKMTAALHLSTGQAFSVGYFYCVNSHLLLRSALAFTPSARSGSAEHPSQTPRSSAQKLHVFLTPGLCGQGGVCGFVGLHHVEKFQVNEDHKSHDLLPHDGPHGGLVPSQYIVP